MTTPTPAATRRSAFLHRQKGVALLEALVAFLIVTFGMLALLGLHLRLTQSAELARQRGEAVRLAQSTMEQQRAYTQTAAAGGVTSWDGLAGAVDQPSLLDRDGGSTVNTTYTRTLTYPTQAHEGFKVAQVEMTWNDRADRAHTVSMRSIIAKQDPRWLGSLAFPKEHTSTLRRPRDRNMNIPIPAREIGDGKSALDVRTGLTVVFSNDSATVIKLCDFEVQVAADLARCSDYSAYILAGYVTKTMATFPTSLGVDTAALTRSGEAPGNIECIFGDAQNQNTLGTIDATKYYLCVIPVAKDGSWSGRVRLAGMAAGTDHLVCRFQYPEDNDLSTPNERNVQDYDKVVQSLDNQNYILTTSRTCPTITSATRLATALETTQHQDCRSSNANRAAECP